QPLPDDLEAARARPYSIVGAEWREVPRIYFNDAPASAMYTTADDMSRFMRLLLDGNGGDASQGGVLGASSIGAMLRPQFANHPAVTGLTFGMRERRDGGITSYEQGGDWQDYSSDLIVSPEARTAMFVAFSGEGGDVIAESLWQAIVAADQ